MEDRGAWCAVVHGMVKNQIQLSNWATTNWHAKVFSWGSLNPMVTKLLYQSLGGEFWHTVNPEGPNEVKQKHGELLRDWKWLNIEGMLELEEGGDWSLNQVGKHWDSWEPSALRFYLLPECGLQAGPLITLHSRDEGNSYITASLWGPSRLTAGNPWAQVKQSSMSQTQTSALVWISSTHMDAHRHLKHESKAKFKSITPPPPNCQTPLPPQPLRAPQVHGSRAHNVNTF